MKRSTRGVPRVALVLATVGALACGSPAPQAAPRFDLVEELPLARQTPTPPVAGAEEAAPARADGDTLLVPPGVRVHYSLVLPPLARIVFESSRPQGAAEGTLRVSVTPHDGATRPLAKLSGARGRTEIEWRAAEPQVARLSLAADAGGGAMAVFRPAVWPAAEDRPTGESARLDRRQLRELRRVRRPNVLVYLIDSLRADRLGCYGYEKSVSPAIDAFAESALVFENATANSSWTKSAVASIFTGLWPGSHRAITREDKLPAAAFTLAEALRGAGYATFGISTNPSIAAEFGFEQGFDELILLDRYAYAEEVTARAAEWLRGFDGERPFFLYLHTLDPHDPYAPPPAEFDRWTDAVSRAFATRTNETLNRLNRSATRREDAPQIVAALEALYDGEIAANDRAFGDLLQLLDETGRASDTVVIVVADHGEDFGEHGAWRHGELLTRESLHVPLLIRLPGEHRVGREPSLVQQIDILPTLLELLELEAPRPVEGESLLPLFVGRGRPAADAPAFFYVRFSPPARIGILWRDWKLVSWVADGGQGPGRSRLYNLGIGSGERQDLSRRFPVMRDYLRARLARKLLDRELALTREQTEISPETERALRALGYLQ